LEAKGYFRNSVLQGRFTNDQARTALAEGFET
jgi:hypothetical protein